MWGDSVLSTVTGASLFTSFTTLPTFRVGWPVEQKLSARGSMTAKVDDHTAEKLESSGLWRRAAGRWLDVMQSDELSDAQRDWVRQRRNHCLSCVPRQRGEDKVDFAAISRGVKAAEARMGLISSGDKRGGGTLVSPEEGA